MDLGVMMFPTDLAIAPARLAQEAEARGFESVWFPEHTHIPTSRRTPYPGGEPIPEEYKRTFDPFVALASAAAVTERLRLATGICLLAQRDPIVTAKEVASLDVLSGGRFVFGIGFGWNRDEMEHHGVDYRERREIVREKVLAMKALWRGDEASFEGRHVRFSSSWQWPKPLQRPHPPVLIGGGGGPTMFRHVAEYADGWMPNRGSGLGGHIAALQAECERQGRDPKTVEVMVFGARPDRGQLDHYRGLGITRVALGLPPADADVVLPLLDRYAELLPGY